MCGDAAVRHHDLCRQGHTLRQETVEHVNTDVLVAATGGNRTGHGQPENQHAQDLVAPDETDIEEIAQHDLAGGQQDHRGQVGSAGDTQHQDTGAKMVHAASDTTSTIVAKSICKDGGRAGYRGLVRVEPGAERVKSFVRCDALILDDESVSDTYPYMDIRRKDAEIGHEAGMRTIAEYVQNAEALALLRSLADAHQAQLLLPHETICAGARCALLNQGRPLYHDTDHLTITGALQLRAMLEGAFREIAQ